MRKWIWGVLATVLVAAVVVPAVVVRGAEGDRAPRDRGDRERAMRPMPEQPAGPADMQHRAQMLRSQIQTLQHSAEAFDQQGMGDLADQMRERARQSEQELRELTEAMQRAGGGPRHAGPMPGGPMPDMMQMARHHEDMLNKLLQGQDQLRAQLGELNDKVSALQKEMAGLRDQLHR